MVEGPLAGGHLGFSFEELKDKTAIFTLLEKTVKEVVMVAEEYGKERGKKIPVIAAGGIFDGKDIARMLKTGASGVQMATRFVCTDECEASDAFKQAYLKAKKEDIVIIQSPVGMLGRALKNKFLERIEKGQVHFECHYQCLKICKQSESPYCICQALVDAVEGHVDEGVVFVGANVDRVNKIVPVRELMAELVNEAEANY